MQISVSTTLTLYHDGQFWVGIVEHIEYGRLGAARIVFGAEPSDAEVLQFVIERWHTLLFPGNQDATIQPAAKNPKRRQREAMRALRQPTACTKAQAALAVQRETAKQEAIQLRKQKRDEEKQKRFDQRAEKRREKRRGR